MARNHNRYTYPDPEKFQHYRVIAFGYDRQNSLIFCFAVNGRFVNTRQAVDLSLTQCLGLFDYKQKAASLAMNWKDGLLPRPEPIQPRKSRIQSYRAILP